MVSKTPNTEAGDKTPNTEAGEEIAKAGDNIAETVNKILEIVNNMDPISFLWSVSITVIVVLVIAALFFITWEMLKDKVTRGDKNRDIIINEIYNIRKIDDGKFIAVPNDLPNKIMDLPNEIMEKINARYTTLMTEVTSHLGEIKEEIKAENNNQQKFINAQQDNLEKAFGTQKEYLRKFYGEVKKSTDDTQLALKELEQSYKIFQKSLESKDEEIKRLKQGYDATLHEKFVGRFINLYVNMETEIKNATQEHKDGYTHLREALKIALEESNVAVLSPDLGEKIDAYQDYLDLKNSSRVSTDDQNKHFTIADVISPAFILEGQEKRKILRHAIVRFYVSGPQQSKVQSQHSNQQ